MTDEIQFEDPPPKKGGNRKGSPLKFVAFFDALRTQPGQWAKWPSTYKTSGGTSAAKDAAGRYGADIEATERLFEDGRVHVWVRLVK